MKKKQADICLPQRVIEAHIITKTELETLSKGKTNWLLWNLFSLLLGASISLYSTLLLSENTYTTKLGLISVGLFLFSLLILIIAISEHRNKNKLIEKITGKTHNTKISIIKDDWKEA